MQRLHAALSRKEVELEQAGTEVQRLLGTLSKKESELAAVREGVWGVETESARSKDVVSKAETRAAEAEAEPEPQEQPLGLEDEEEGLSLRERLTRAAAARHRSLGKPDA
ncbi:MAG TPA: hypothetical protein VF029_02145 [Actinomycetota bacterium]